MGVATTRIYVALLDEGTAVWRPVDAIALGNNRFVVLAPTEMNDETWMFQPGEIVSCEAQTFASGETGLVARSRIHP